MAGVTSSTAHQFLTARAASSTNDARDEALQERFQQNQSGQQQSVPFQGFRTEGRTDIVDVIAIKAAATPEVGKVAASGGTTNPTAALPSQATTEEGASLLRQAARTADAQRFRPATRAPTVQPRYQVQDKREDLLGQNVEIAGAESQARNIERGFNPYTEQISRPHQIRTPDGVNLASEPPQSRFANSTRADDLLAPTGRVTGAQSQRDNAAIGSNVYTNSLVAAQTSAIERHQAAATPRERAEPIGEFPEGRPEGAVTLPDQSPQHASNHLFGTHPDHMLATPTKIAPLDEDTIVDPFRPEQRQRLDDEQAARARNNAENAADGRAAAAYRAALLDIKA